MSRKPPPWALVITAVVVLLVVLALRWRVWTITDPQSPALEPAAMEIVPPGIIVSEESIPTGVGGGAPGNRDLAGYAAPGGTDLEDMRMLAGCASAFLTIHKQAAERPLSANEEWSAALRGQRHGTSRWLEDGPPVFSTDGKIIDRHGTPVHFHALGAKAWELRSAGPDKLLFTDDDAVGSIGEARR